MSAARRIADRAGLAGLGLATLVLAVGLILGLYMGFFQELLREEGRIVRAEFDATQQLRVGDPVRMNGRKEGRVVSIERTNGGRTALVEMELGDEAGTIYADARAELRMKNLLGGFFVHLERGSPKAGELVDAVIPRSRTLTQPELDDLLTVLDDPALDGTKTMIRELRRTLDDRTSLAEALDAVADVSPNAAAGLAALRGHPAEQDLRRLVRSVGRTVSALDTPQADLRQLVGGAAATLRTTAARQAELRTFLSQGPALADSVRSTLARLDPTLARAENLVERLDRSVADVAPTLRKLRPTVSTTVALLGDARPLLRSLRPTVERLASAGRTGVPLLRDLDASLDRVDRVILPFLAEPDPETGKSTTVMIGGFAAGFGGSAGQQDANGHFIRFPASAGDTSVHLPCRTALTDPSQEDLLVCQELGKALETYLNYVPPLAALLGGGR